MLAVSPIVVLAGAAAWIFLGNHAVGPFNKDVAQQIVDNGISAFESRNVDGVMLLISPETNFMQHSAEQIRGVLRQTMEELGTSNLKISCTNLSVNPGNSQGSFNFDLNVSEKTPKAKITYYKMRMNLQVSRQKIPFFYGLGSREAWRITSASSEPVFELPTVERD